MGRILSLVDRLTNVMSGMGTTADKRAAAFYSFAPMTGAEAEAGYRSSWLVRKIIDIPPFDMTREWRDWQAEGSDIEKIEAEERRLQLKAKCQRALVLARLYGGGALILGTSDLAVDQPLNPATVKAGGLRYVHVMSRWQLSEGQPRLDPADPWYMQPDYFSLTGANGEQVRIHPSRVVAFIGQRAPEGSFYPSSSWFWGDPLMQSIGEAIKNADLAQSGFASLIDRAAVDVFKFKNLMSQVSTEEGTANVQKRVTWASQVKSQYRAMILDTEDEWAQIQLTWSGIPETMLAFMDVVAGAADIPLTRLLGQSPRGLQSTGDGEQDDYHAMVQARQSELLTPALDRIDELLIPSALGSRPSDVYYEYGALEDTSEAEAAGIEKDYATAIQMLASTGTVPDTVLTAMVRGRSIESGRWPGVEAAWEESDADPEPDPADDLAQLTTLEQRVAAMEKKGTVTADQALALIRDAAPRSLYVSRKLLNAQAVIDWAKGQGFATTIPADQMHVTVLYSRQPVDWMQMGQSWDQDNNGQLRIPPGGPRMLDEFGGTKDAVVLLFNSSSLCWRHEDMVSRGATSDYPEFCPHVTITYDAPDDLDLSKVEPYQGELVFGPEVFAEVQEDWKSGIVEDGGSPQGGVPFGDAKRRGRRGRGRSFGGGGTHHFDPAQPRGPNGRWIPAAHREFVNLSASGQTDRKRLLIGKVSAEARRRIRLLGLEPGDRDVALNASRVRHALLSHGRQGKSSVSATEIASADFFLNKAERLRLARANPRGGPRFISSTKYGGGRTYAVFEIGKRGITLVTMWKGK